MVRRVVSTVTSWKTGPDRDDGPRVCSIADALQLVGDRWSLLVVREIGFGVTRFNDIQRLTGAPRENSMVLVPALLRPESRTRTSYQNNVA